MLIIRHLSDLPKEYQSRPTVLTVGVFDGVHIAHQAILKETVQHAQKYPAGQTLVYTFENHPLKVLKPEAAPPLLIQADEKISLIEKFGIDILVNEIFTMEFSHTPADFFVKQELCNWLQVKEIIVGHDHNFGKGASGNVTLLRNLGKTQGFTVDEISPIQVEGNTVSSSSIRELLLSGDVSLANRLLGRPHSISGKVIEGFRRGRTLGFPTANLLTQHEVIPRRGVYAVKVLIGNNTHHGIMNIGQRPSFPEAGPSVEVHLFQFNEDIYGRQLKIFFIQKIRDEVKFNTVDSLREQIHQDQLQAIKIFNSV